MIETGTLQSSTKTRPRASGGDLVVRPLFKTGNFHVGKPIPVKNCRDIIDVSFFHRRMENKRKQMLIKVDEFSLGNMKAQPKPNNGERETNEEKSIKRAKFNLGWEVLKKEHHTVGLAP
ncbi:hypothetical protein AVEN_20105-1 [Araneus ventricosus]|uniref:Uncharacterized protein n=1 Tax=Araneus ventricosus TaxID=182803 RepID=A0A4Y2SN40_ARAVE|nr:hypothetical protein AVEN_20105-1 [Araneus ventricosus]